MADGLLHRTLCCLVTIAAAAMAIVSVLDEATGGGGGIKESISRGLPLPWLSQSLSFTNREDGKDNQSVKVVVMRQVVHSCHFLICMMGGVRSFSSMMVAWK